MKKFYRILLFTLVFLVFALVVYFPAHKQARAHVNYVTAVEDHPLNCFSCHLYISKSGFISKLINKDYLSPFNLTVSKDGKRLYVVAQEGNALLVVDVEKQDIISKIRVGERPHSAILNRDEKFAYVSNQWSDNVSVIDLASYRVINELKTDAGPAGLALSADGHYLYVVNSFSSNISIFDLQTNEEQKRLSAGNNPTGAQLSPDGKDLYVTSRRAIPAPYGTTLNSELTIVNTISQRVAEHKNIESAYMMENVAFTPSGDLALMTLIRPKNLVPSIQVERGWMMTNGFGIVEQKANGRTVQLLLDEPNQYFADPFDIVITPDGRKAFVSSSGVDCISVVDMDSVRTLLAKSTDEELRTYSNHLDISNRYVVKRIHTGANPKGLAISPDGKYLYVAEQLEDRIRIISTESLEIINSIDLGGPHSITVARQGRRLFNNAGHTFQNQYSCYTCHPDAHEDGLVYNMASKDMGRNLTNTMSLRDIGDTPPYKWTGKNQTIYKQDGMRFSTVLTRTEAFSYSDLDALVAYIMRGIPNPPNLKYNPTGELTESQLRGKAIYERTHDNLGNEIPENNRCITCHPPPFYTNKKMAYVGTLAASDDSMLFDTPHLNNIFASAPYLHDGRANSLEEIWTKNNPNDKHGVSNDMTKNQLNDLVDYLKSLRDPAYEAKTPKVTHFSILSK
jgi:YVTN family beta-propeller protein